MTSRACWTIAAFSLFTAMGCRGIRNNVKEAPTASLSSPGGGSLKTGALLRDTARVVEGVGAGPLQEVGMGVRRMGESLDGFAFLPKGRCAVLYARGGPSIIDLDLHAYADDGTQFGADEAPDDLPTLVVCSEDVPRRLFLSAKVAQGEGLVALGLHDVPLALKDTVGKTVGAGNRLSKFDPRAQAWPSLNDEVSAHLRVLGGAWTDLRRVALPVDARMPTRLDADIPARRCLSWLSVPEDPYLQLDTVISSAEGRILSRGAELEGKRYAVVCTGASAQRVHFELRPQAGQGLVLVAMNLSKEASAPLDFPEQGAKVVWVGDPPIADTTVQAGLLDRRPIELEAGRIETIQVNSRGCQKYWVDGVAMAPPVQFHAYSQSGSLLGDLGGASRQALTVCYDGELHLELECSQDVPRAFLSIFRGVTPKKVMLRHPLAASRALLRADYLIPASDLRGVQAAAQLQLSEKTVSKTEVMVGAASCSTFTVGSETASGWLDLRLVFADDDSAPLHAGGRSSAAISYCSRESQTGYLEIRRDGAPSEALLLELRHAPSDPVGGP